MAYAETIHMRLEKTQTGTEYVFLNETLTSSIIWVENMGTVDGWIGKGEEGDNSAERDNLK